MEFKAVVLLTLALALVSIALPQPVVSSTVVDFCAHLQYHNPTIYIDAHSFEDIYIYVCSEGSVAVSIRAYRVGLLGTIYSEDIDITILAPDGRVLMPTTRVSSYDQTIHVYSGRYLLQLDNTYSSSGKYIDIAVFFHSLSQNVTTTSTQTIVWLITTTTTKTETGTGTETTTILQPTTVVAITPTTITTILPIPTTITNTYTTTITTTIPIITTYTTTTPTTIVATVPTTVTTTSPTTYTTTVTTTLYRTETETVTVTTEQIRWDVTAGIAVALLAIGIAIGYLLKRGGGKEQK